MLLDHGGHEAGGVALEARRHGGVEDVVAGIRCLLVHPHHPIDPDGRARPPPPGPPALSPVLVLPCLLSCRRGTAQVRHRDVPGGAPVRPRWLSWSGAAPRSRD
ncbi:hypothetical protein GCM10011374_19070 [Kocuria dechangensis]|uniref:Uncharacterized protein n=1 Tax=Kocuria dechangensis TaxID=1176249 RepID=A0A917GTG7_9MICC|nr:hypothetical protein GCM10011374_19070 [Kocuria dechangensis]